MNWKTLRFMLLYFGCVTLIGAVLGVLARFGVIDGDALQGAIDRKFGTHSAKPASVDSSALSGGVPPMNPDDFPVIMAHKKHNEEVARLRKVFPIEGDFQRMVKQLEEHEMNAKGFFRSNSGNSPFVSAEPLMDRTSDSLPAREK